MSRTLSSKTLPFAEHLLAIGRILDRMGQTHAAAHLMERVCRLEKLPSDVAEDAQVLLAELHLQRGEFKKARRCLSAALALASNEAHCHFLMGNAIEDDEDGNPQRALFHYRKCVKLEPENATYWCALGTLALRLGETEEGVEASTQAMTLAPDDNDILDDVVHALWDVEDLARARQILQAALFRDPRDQFRRALLAQQQFKELHAEQKEAKRRTLYGHRPPAILRFAIPKNAPTVTGHIRHDMPSGLPGPKRPLPRRTPDKRRAHR